MPIRRPDRPDQAWRELASLCREEGDGYAALVAMAQATLPARLIDHPEGDDDVAAGWCELQRWAAALGVDVHQLPAAAAAGVDDQAATAVVRVEVSLSDDGFTHVTWICPHHVSNVRDCREGCHQRLGDRPAVPNLMSEALVKAFYAAKAER